MKQRGGLSLGVPKISDFGQSGDPKCLNDQISATPSVCTKFSGRFAANFLGDFKQFINPKIAKKFARLRRDFDLYKVSNPQNFARLRRDFTIYKAAKSKIFAAFGAMSIHCKMVFLRRRQENF